PFRTGAASRSGPTSKCTTEPTRENERCSSRVSPWLTCRCPAARSGFDMTAVMDHFGFKQFLLAGHDRGARLSHRIALDNPDRVLKLAVLDVIPTIEHFERADMDFALGYYHWFWFAQPHPFPEWLINRAPEDWWRQHTSRDPLLPALFHPDALADYLAAVRQPEMGRG